MFSKPMSAGDSTLMMLLSLNLLLLVFFMMLNSMATYGKKHAEEVLTSVREGYDLAGKAALRGSETVPEVPMAAWRSGVVSRLQGVIVNRIELRTLPQQGNASSVEMVMPLSAVFRPDGQVLEPELMRNIAAAAGSESRIIWQVLGPLQDGPRLARMVAALALEAGRAEMVVAAQTSVKLVVTPGLATRPDMGLKLQSVGEDAGAKVQGVDEKAGNRE